MRIGVVVGFVAEARIARRLGWPVAVGGGTAQGADRAATGLLDSGAEALISFGLAGGLDPALRPGSVIVPQAVLAGERYATTALLGEMAPHVMLGADAVVADVAQKRELFQRTGAAAVDLESGAVARVATRRGVPFAVVRAICDPAERALPPAALAALDARGAIGLRRVLASVIAQPSQLSTLAHLALDAMRAREALRRFVIARSRATKQ